MSLGAINLHQLMKLGQVNYLNIIFNDIHMLWLFENLCISLTDKKNCINCYHRFEHCGAVTLESCTSLFTSCQQCFKEGLSSNFVMGLICY